MNKHGAYRESLCRSADGCEIFYNEMGEGETVVLCDGIGCDQYAWTYLAPVLAERYHVVRWNYRGHGRSGPPPRLASMTLPRLGDDLDAVMKALGNPKAVFIGHSMGTQVILQQWQRHPEQVQALVALCGAYGRPLDTFRGTDLASKVFPYVRRLLGTYPNLTQAIWEHMVPTHLAMAIAAKFEVNIDLVRISDFLPYLDHLGHMDVQVFLSLLEDISQRSAEAYLQDIDVATLILAAEHDSFTPARLAEFMHQQIRKSEYLLVPLSTHTMPIEMPDLVNLKVEKFLRERVFGDCQGQVPLQA